MSSLAINKCEPDGEERDLGRTSRIAKLLSSPPQKSGLAHKPNSQSATTWTRRLRLGGGRRRRAQLQAARLHGRAASSTPEIATWAEIGDWRRRPPAQPRPEVIARRRTSHARSGRR